MGQVEVTFEELRATGFGDRGGSCVTYFHSK